MSSRADFGATLDAFTLLHLRLAWTLSPAWRLEGRVENVGDRDYTLVQALVMLVATFFLLINFFVDIAYAFLDPRVRYA